MKSGVNTVDINKLNKHLLGAYQIVTNFTPEICDYYVELLNVYFNKGTLYELTTPVYISGTISRTNRN